MDKTMQQEHEDMDQMIKQERAAVDKAIKNDREIITRELQRERDAIDNNMKHERATMDRTLKRVHEDMDRTLQKERNNIDQIVPTQCAKVEFKIMQARADKEKNLRKDLEYKAKMEQLLIEVKMMQDRAKKYSKEQCDFPSTGPSLSYSLLDMDQKLQPKHNDMDYEGMMEQILMESKIMQDRASIVRKVEPEQDNIPLPEPYIPVYLPVDPDQDDIPLQADNNPANPPVEPDQDDIPLPGPDIPANPVVPIMEFRVFKDREFSDVPKGLEDLPGYTIFNEPPAWPSMVSNLSYQGYEGNADLYYITPGCVPPEDMVLISCQEHVDEMMQALDGRNKCDLYIVTNCPYSGSEDGYGSEDGMNRTGSAYADSLVSADVGTPW